MKFKKILLVFSLLFGLSACAKPEVPLDISIFYLEHCANCQNLHQNLLPQLEKQFNGAIHITSYDMDIEENSSKYDDIVSQLDVEDSAIFNDYQVPFLVVEGYYGILGYSQSLDEMLLKSIESILNKEDFRQQLSIKSGIWFYKEEYRGT